MLSRARFEADWQQVAERIAPFGISQVMGGVNDGDRRAIYQLVRALGCTRVLEIGTHIGASSVHIVSALHENTRDTGGRPEFITADIVDVNSPHVGGYSKLGLPMSPRDMIRALGFEDFTHFVHGKAEDFMKTVEGDFDLIFLDGDHSAAAVYREIPLALELLRPGGVILLHDYFPDGRPLWGNGEPILGPFKGARKHMQDGAGFEVIPLGALEWPTKLGSNVTSLAMVVRRGH